MVIANDTCSIEKKIKKIVTKDIHGSELRFGAQGSEIFIPESYMPCRIQETIGLTILSSKPHLWAPSAITFFFYNSKNPDPPADSNSRPSFCAVGMLSISPHIQHQKFADVWLKYPLEACVDDAVVLCCTVLSGSQHVRDCAECHDV